MALSAQADATAPRGATAMRGDGFWIVSAAAFSAVFLLTAWVSVAPSSFNIRTAILINQLLLQLPPTMVALALLVTTPELQGVVVVALLWGAWFACADERLRARLIAGLAGAIGAAIVAHFLQHAFPSGPKPLFLPGFQASEQLHALMGPFDEATMSGRSFPSERGTLFAGVAILTAIAEPRTGILSLGLTLFVEMMRVLLGLHYAADIAGSFGLAGALVCLCSLSAPAGVARIAVAWEKSATSLFYSAAFVISHQLLTTFDGLRWLLSLLVRALSQLVKAE